MTPTAHTTLDDNEEKLRETAKFKCHAKYVIGFNLALAALIYGAVALMH